MLPTSSGPRRDPHGVAPGTDGSRDMSAPSAPGVSAASRGLPLVIAAAERGAMSKDCGSCIEACQVLTLLAVQLH